MSVIKIHISGYWRANSCETWSCIVLVHCARTLLGTIEETHCSMWYVQTTRNIFAEQSNNVRIHWRHTHITQHNAVIGRENIGDGVVWQQNISGAIYHFIIIYAINSDLCSVLCSFTRIRIAQPSIREWKCESRFEKIVVVTSYDKCQSSGDSRNYVEIYRTGHDKRIPFFLCTVIAGATASAVNPFVFVGHSPFIQINSIWLHQHNNQWWNQ